MQELIAAGKIAVTTGVTMLATTKASVNIEDGRISVVVAVTCTVFICGIVWWLSSKFQELADSNKQTAIKFEEISKSNKLTNDRLDAIERRIADTEFRQQSRDNNDDKKGYQR